MKNYILPLVIFFALMSCNEENPQPVSPFVGSWSLTSSDIPVTIAFDVVYEGSGVFNYHNVKVVHPAIPTDEQTNCTMITYDKFANGLGYGRIEINSRGGSSYNVTLIYNRFTEDGMGVYDVQIDIPSEPFIVLTDQTFTKNN